MIVKLGVALALVIGLSANAVAQVAEVPADTVIRPQRTSCLGPCPIYTVTIDARGTVTYEGEKFVRVIGRQTAQIAPSAVATLLASAERIHFFDLRDAYRAIENPDGTVTVVTDYQGDTDADRDGCRSTDTNTSTGISTNTSNGISTNINTSTSGSASTITSAYASGTTGPAPKALVRLPVGRDARITQVGRSRSESGWDMVRPRTVSKTRAVRFLAETAFYSMGGESTEELAGC